MHGFLKKSLKDLCVDAVIIGVPTFGSGTTIGKENESKWASFTVRRSGSEGILEGREGIFSRFDHIMVRGFRGQPRDGNLMSLSG